MKKSLVAIAALFALGLAGTANADEVRGTLEAMDIGSRTIVLDDGNAYTVSEGVAIESLEPGTEVTVSFEEQGGQKIATEVTPAN